MALKWMRFTHTCGDTHFHLLLKPKAKLPGKTEQIRIPPTLRHKALKYTPRIFAGSTPNGCSGFARTINEAKALEPFFITVYTLV